MTWPTKKLGEIARIFSGSSAPQDEKYFKNGKYPFVRVFDLATPRSGELVETRDYVNDIAIEELNLIEAKKGAIVFPKSGASILNNNRAVLGVSAYVVNHLSAIEVNEDLAMRNWVYYFLSKFDMGGLVSDPGYPSLNISAIGKIKIPVPPLAIQKQIVERLDKIVEAQKLNDALIRKTEELFQSLLHKELNPTGKDWEVKKMKDACIELFAGGDVPKNNFSKTKTEKYNIPIFANGIEGKNLYGYTNIKKIFKPAVTISARGTIGYPAIRKEAFYPIVRLIVLIPNPKILDLYFLYYSIYNFNFSKTGTSIPQLTIPTVERVKIFLPPLQEQKQIVAKLSAVQEYKKQLLEQKAKLKELFDSVLSKSMKGEL